MDPSDLQQDLGYYLAQQQQQQQQLQPVMFDGSSGYLYGAMDGGVQMAQLMPLPLPMTPAGLGAAPAAPKQRAAAASKRAKAGASPGRSSPNSGAAGGVRAPKIPIPRVKAIMKEDEDILLVGLDAATAVGFAAEMFLEYFAEKCCEAATRDHRKTVAYKDMGVYFFFHHMSSKSINRIVARTVREVSNLNFLEDLFPPMVTVKKAMDQKALLAKRAAAGNAAEDDEEELGLDEKNGEQADGEGIDNGADEDLRAQDDQEEEQYAAEEEEDEEDH